MSFIENNDIKVRITSLLQKINNVNTLIIMSILITLYDFMTSLINEFSRMRYFYAK